MLINQTAPLKSQGIAISVVVRRVILYICAPIINREEEAICLILRKLGDRVLAALVKREQKENTIAAFGSVGERIGNRLKARDTAV